MLKALVRGFVPLALAATAVGCSNKDSPETPATARNKEANPATASNVVVLTLEQIDAAGIALVRPMIGDTGGTLERPATIAGDPQGTQVVSAVVGGRLVSLNRNLGQTVRRGDTLAVIESREAAQLNGQVEASRARAALADSLLRREQRLFAERVSPEQDLLAASTAATEANIALRQAQQQLSAAGGGAGALNRLAIRSPLSGQVIARSATLGQTVAADAEIYRVANLATLSLEISLSSADAGRVRPGASVELVAPGRRGTARVTFISPTLDVRTRLVPVIATIDNRAGQWRVGEGITAAIQLAGTEGKTISVPRLAVQTIADKPVVFVRTKTGFRAQAVLPGASDGDRIVITSGLTGGEQIAATNSFTLKAELGKGAGEEEE